MEHLGHGDAEEVVEVAASGAPAPVLVIAEAVEEHVPEDKAVTTHNCPNLSGHQGDI